MNSLTFNYRGGGNVGALKPLDEESIDYSDFLDRLDKGQVAFVEFLAPYGDRAYATIKVEGSGGDDDVGAKAKGTSKRIRIGKGYPVEDHEGWSSPSFVIRSVKEKGVPYKFVVPELEKFAMTGPK